MPLPKVSYDYFRSVWKKRLWEEIRIRGGSSTFAKCDQCERIKKERASTRSWEAHKALDLEESAHRQAYSLEHKEYGMIKQRAIQWPNKYLSIGTDGADQAANGLPYFRQPTKASSTIRKLRQYLTGVIVHGDAPVLIHHLPKFERGANVTIEVLHMALTHVYKKHKALRGRLPNVLCVQVDNCWRENKNKWLIAWLCDRVYSSVPQFSARGTHSL